MNLYLLHQFNLLFLLVVDSITPIYTGRRLGIHVPKFNASCSIIKETLALELLNELVKNMRSFFMSSFNNKNSIRWLRVLVSPIAPQFILMLSLL